MFRNKNGGAGCVHWYLLSLLLGSLNRQLENLCIHMNHTYTSILISVSIYLHVYIKVSTIYVNKCVYMCDICTYTHTYIYACVCVYMHTYTYMYIYLCKHKHKIIQISLELLLINWPNTVPNIILKALPCIWNPRSVTIMGWCPKTYVEVLTPSTSEWSYLNIR